MRRYAKNPILKPIEEHAWESRQVFNPAAVYLNGKVHLLYRAMGNDNISRLGYACSSDGITIDERFPNPVFEPMTESEKDGCEDPRLTEINGQLLLVYTALKEFNHLQSYQVGVTAIAKDDFLQRKWNWGGRRLPFPGVRNKDGVLFPEKINGKYVMLHRIDPDICITYSDDLVHWCDISCVMKPQVKGWDNWRIGAGGPPIKISEGWLIIYHGVNVEKMYSLGIAVLDKEHPENVLYRSKTHILAPREDYERFGKVPNVVFSCGNIILDDQIYIYYGAADTVVGVGTIGFDKVLSLIHR